MKIQRLPALISSGTCAGYMNGVYNDCITEMKASGFVYIKYKPSAHPNKK
ncbi:hypothetical protein MMC2321_03287 [Chitinophaga sp. MM2321]